MKKICIISHLHLSANPRVWKEANTLAKAGYKVVILTIWTSSERRDKDLALIKNPNITYKAVINLIPGESSVFKRLYYRFQGRIGKEIKKKLNIDTNAAIGVGYNLFTGKAFKENAALFICHTEYGMNIGNFLIRKNKKVAFDFEDWYSRDYLVPERPVRLLNHLESFSIKYGCYITCPSHSMAIALQKEYNPKKEITVVYNGFSISENNTITNLKPGATPSLIWFSQTIGTGRGIETLLIALGFVSTSVELHLIGNCTVEYEQVLKKSFPFNRGHKLYINKPVEHDQLLSLLAQHTIGLALEQEYPESRNKTITNKILQYLQAGIKILATYTMGQSEVAEFSPDSIELVPVNEPKQWAHSIEKLLNKTIDKKLQQHTFENFFSWEVQEKKLLDIVSHSV